MRLVLMAIVVGAISLAGTPAGVWKMNAARSTFAGDIQPKSLTLWIEAHAKGEGFTLDRIEADGRATSSSTVLYFERHCPGRRRCRRGWIRFVRRSSERPNELVLEIAAQQPGGRWLNGDWFSKNNRRKHAEGKLACSYAGGGRCGTGPN
jgi:hypothetical protein